MPRLLLILSCLFWTGTSSSAQQVSVARAFDCTSQIFVTRDVMKAQRANGEDVSFELIEDLTEIAESAVLKTTRIALEDGEMTEEELFDEVERTYKEKSDGFSRMASSRGMPFALRVLQERFEECYSLMQAGDF